MSKIVQIVVVAHVACHKSSTRSNGQCVHEQQGLSSIIDGECVQFSGRSGTYWYHLECVSADTLHDARNGLPYGTTKALREREMLQQDIARVRAEQSARATPAQVTTGFKAIRERMYDDFEEPITLVRTRQGHLEINPNENPVELFCKLATVIEGGIETLVERAGGLNNVLQFVEANRKLLKGKVAPQPESTEPPAAGSPDDVIAKALENVS